MVVDLSKIRPGDEVTVRMTVNSIRAGCGVALAFEAREPTVLSALEGRIVSHTPQGASGGRSGAANR